MGIPEPERMAAIERLARYIMKGVWDSSSGSSDENTRRTGPTYVTTGDHRGAFHKLHRVRTRRRFLSPDSTECTSRTD